MSGLEQTAFTKTPKRTRKNYRTKQHVDAGFPHYSSAHPHHCMCLDECCFSYQDGCICKTCSCKFGFGHEPYLESELAELEAQRVAKAQHNTSGT